MFTGLEYWLGLLLLAALGVLGASSVIVKKKPEAGELIDRLAKVSGWVGLVSALWGLWVLIGALRTLRVISVFPLHWLTMLATAAVLIGLGFIFGYGMVTTYLSAEARQKGEQLRRKLLGYQLVLGYVSLGLVAWWLLLRFVF
ncbi:MAG: hypothetical protein DRI34_03370 [Deltaproteobacteria bacterium]|nr:MAG: hypothetical protein DRI34_03370 [Deltaproteobacteria bacterium]